MHVKASDLTDAELRALLSDPSPEPLTVSVDRIAYNLHFPAHRPFIRLEGGASHDVRTNQDSHCIHVSGGSGDVEIIGLWITGSNTLGHGVRCAEAHTGTVRVVACSKPRTGIPVEAGPGLL